MNNETNQMNTPYYAVIFTSIKNEQSIGYQEMAQQMWVLAQEQPGSLEWNRQEMN